MKHELSTRSDSDLINKTHKSQMEGVQPREWGWQLQSASFEDTMRPFRPLVNGLYIKSERDCFDADTETKYLYAQRVCLL